MKNKLLWHVIFICCITFFLLSCHSNHSTTGLSQKGKDYIESIKRSHHCVDIKFSDVTRIDPDLGKLHIWSVKLVSCDEYLSLDSVKLHGGMVNEFSSTIFPELANHTDYQAVEIKLYNDTDKNVVCVYLYLIKNNSLELKTVYVDKIP